MSAMPRPRQRSQKGGSVEPVSNLERSGLLRKALKDNGFCRILEVHSPAAAIIAERSRGSNREFDGFWSSSLTDSALRGLPDTELLDPRSRIEWATATVALTKKPLIIDGDTGGRCEHFAFSVRHMEREGLSAVIIEDKAGEKRNSLLSGDDLHTMAGVDAFAEKIAVGKAAQASDGFMVIARLEGLITGLPREEILARAAAYVAAGADGLVVHSRSSDENLVIGLARELRVRHPDTPLVAIPTAYPGTGEDELIRAGINLVIYANQMFRASLLAMESVAQSILDNGRALEAEPHCLATHDLLHLTEGLHESRGPEFARVL
ncbi:MAG: isocitrate lyase/phosphoenolpyruvate mutase family protein [Rhodococcus sp. (in: high G+C Gram-positive bacteria)]